MRIVIFGNGEPPAKELVLPLISKDDTVLCADGGAKHALELGLKIRAVIGDFDSLSAEHIEVLKAQTVELRRFPKEKDKTDLELAMLFAMELGASELLLVACLGGQIDHLLCNLQLCARSDFAGLSVRILDHVSPQKIGEIVHAPAQVKITGKVGDSFSILPLTSQATIAELTGARWSLMNYTLKQGETLGLSNYLVKESAELKLEKGVAMVFSYAVKL